MIEEFCHKYINSYLIYSLLANVVTVEKCYFSAFGYNNGFSIVTIVSPDLFFNMTSSTFRDCYSQEAGYLTMSNKLSIIKKCCFLDPIGPTDLISAFCERFYLNSSIFNNKDYEHQKTIYADLYLEGSTFIFGSNITLLSTKRMHSLIYRPSQNEIVEFNYDYFNIVSLASINAIIRSSYISCDFINILGTDIYYSYLNFNRIHNKYSTIFSSIVNHDINESYFENCTQGVTDSIPNPYIEPIKDFLVLEPPCKERSNVQERINGADTSCFIISHSAFYDLFSLSSGGAISISANPILFTANDVVFKGCKTQLKGGAIFIEYIKELNMDKICVYNCSAPKGSILFVQDGMALLSIKSVVSTLCTDLQYNEFDSIYFIETTNESVVCFTENNITRNKGSMTTLIYSESPVEINFTLFKDNIERTSLLSFLYVIFDSAHFINNTVAANRYLIIYNIAQVNKCVFWSENTIEMLASHNATTSGINNTFNKEPRFFGSFAGFSYSVGEAQSLLIAKFECYSPPYKYGDYTLQITLGSIGAVIFIAAMATTVLTIRNRKMTKKRIEIEQAIMVDFG